MSASALVEHLALADGVGRQRQSGRALGDDRAVDVRLHRGDVAGLDVQADDARTGAPAELRCSEGRESLGRESVGFESLGLVREGMTEVAGR